MDDSSVLAVEQRIMPISEEEKQKLIKEAKLRKQMEARFPKCFDCIYSRETGHKRKNRFGQTYLVHICDIHGGVEHGPLSWGCSDWTQ